MRFIADKVAKLGQGLYGSVFQIRLQLGKFAARKFIRPFLYESPLATQDRAYGEYDIEKE